jgi:hypothetical protein
MSGKTIITVWERMNHKEERWEHNHIKDGFDDSELMPTPMNETQKKAWAGIQWRKQKGYLDGIKVVDE